MLNLVQLSSMRQISQEGLVRANACDRQAGVLFGENDGTAKRPVEGKTALLSQLGFREGKDSYLYRVFNGAPQTTLEGIVAHAGSSAMRKEMAVYLTSDYRRMNPKKYYCKVRLLYATHGVLVRKWDDLSMGRGQYMAEAFAEGVYAEHGVVAWNVNEKTDAADEFQIRLPRLHVRQLPELFEMVTCPIVPKELQLLFDDTGLGGTPILDRLAATVPTGTVANVDKGTRLFATSGNASLPFGTHTNVNSPQFNVNNISAAANKQAIEPYLRLYPSWDSVTLSPYAPVRGTSMNGLSVGTYVANDKYAIVDGALVKRVINILACPGHPINNMCRAMLHEVVAKISSGSASLAEQSALVVWAQPPVTGDWTRITPADMVDIITFHSTSTQSIAAKHKDMFVCNEAANRVFAKIEFIDGVFPVFNTDFDRFKLMVSDLADLPIGKNIEVKK